MSYPLQNGPPPVPPMPQAPPKKRRKAGCLGLGCGSLVILAIIIGIAVAVSGGNNKNKTSSPVATVPASGAPATRQAAPAPTTTRSAAPTILLQTQGNGIKNTARFTTGDDWTIHYTYDCSGFPGGTGNFTVYVDYPNGDIPVNALGARGSDSSTETGSGTHTLKVASECPWTLTVTNG